MKHHVCKEMFSERLAGHSDFGVHVSYMAMFNACVGFNSQGQLFRRAAKAEHQIATDFAEGQRRTLTPMIIESC
jgi:hypothetical protein